MTDIDVVIADTVKAGLGARAVSAPPFAFPVFSPPEADDYVSALNDRLERAGATGRTGIIRYAVRLIFLRVRKKMILTDTATGAAIKSRRAIQ